MLEIVYQLIVRNANVQRSVQCREEMALSHSQQMRNIRLFPAWPPEIWSHASPGSDTPHVRQKKG